MVSSEDPVDDLMQELEARLQVLETNLQPRIDGMALSPISKIPGKAIWYRESLAWRMAELSRVGFANIKAHKLVAGVLLTRAAIETSAALWFALKKLESVVKAGAKGTIDDDLMKLSMGSRTDTDISPSAISVLTFVDHADKDVPGFKHQYERLCEIAHPNWGGTAMIYAASEPPGAMNFGPNVRNIEAPYNIAVKNLSGALLMFEYAYNRVSEIIPAFIAICEKECSNPPDGEQEKNDKP